VDNIDLQAAKSYGVNVVNTPVATTTAVAEHTMGLLVSLVRHIPRADHTLKSGKWGKKSLVGMELAEKTLGIIGVGNIGQAVAQRAKGFELNLIGYDPALSATDFESLQVEPVSLPQLYARANIISLHTPLNADTRGMINAAAFDQMKPGVLILSTARGGIIDEDELLQRLNSGQVGGAGLDVYAQEPPTNLELLTHPNVVATPHIAAQTREAQNRAAVHAAEEIERKINGIPLRWQIV
jgi:D-3-phosphoglycerate dehydrogenase